MISVGKTDRGKVRDINEDSIYLNDFGVGMLPNLYIISDGMGGHKAGEIASSLAIDSFVNYITENNFESENFILDFLVNAMHFANSCVYQKSQADSDCYGMGATFSACTFVNKKAYCVHVGDSRIYLINNSSIKQLSVDHTYVNEMVKTGKLTLLQAKNHPQKNIITRAVGIDKNLEVDAFVCNYDFDDRFLICSDGLSSSLNDNEIFSIVNNSQFDSAASNFINAANEKGGLDNISVILICEVHHEN